MGHVTDAHTLLKVACIQGLQHAVHLVGAWTDIRQIPTRQYVDQLGDDEIRWIAPIHRIGNKKWLHKRRRGYKPGSDRGSKGGASTLGNYID